MCPIPPHYPVGTQCKQKYGVQQYIKRLCRFLLSRMASRRLRLLCGFPPEANIQGLHSQKMPQPMAGHTGLLKAPTPKDVLHRHFKRFVAVLRGYATKNVQCPIPLEQGSRVGYHPMHLRRGLPPHLYPLISNLGSVCPVCTYLCSR